MGTKQRSGLRDQILKAAQADPSATHEQIAQRVGCHASTVTKHLQGRSRGRGGARLASVPASAATASLKGTGAAQPAVGTIRGDYGEAGVVLKHGPDGWRRVDTIGTSGLGTSFATAGSYADPEKAAEEYTEKMTGVIVGEAMARTLNEGLLEPEDVPVMLNYIEAMVTRAKDGTAGEVDDTGVVDLGVETPEGTKPVAWKAVALHTIYYAIRDADRAWAEWEGDDIPPRPQLELVDDRFYDHDPLLVRAAQENPDSEWPAPESCIDRALHQVSAGEQAAMPNYPLELLTLDADTSNSPTLVAERTGFGGRIGGDLTAAARLFEAHQESQGYVTISGLIIASQAYRTEPGTPEFEEWLNKHLLVTPEEKQSEYYLGNEHQAIGGLIDICTYEEPDSEVALAALGHIAKIAPDDFKQAVSEYYSWQVDGEDEAAICGGLAANPGLADAARQAISDYKASESKS